LSEDRNNVSKKDERVFFNTYARLPSEDQNKQFFALFRKWAENPVYGLPKLLEIIASHEGEKVIKLWNEEKNQTEIARKLGVSQPAIRYILEKNADKLERTLYGMEKAKLLSINILPKLENLLGDLKKQFYETSSRKVKKEFISDLENIIAGLKNGLKQ